MVNTQSVIGFLLTTSKRDTLYPRSGDLYPTAAVRGPQNEGPLCVSRWQTIDTPVLRSI